MVPPDPGALFLTTLGEQLTPDFMTQQVRRFVLAAEIGKSGSCHLFRHTMATLMLEGGADVRYMLRAELPSQRVAEVASQEIGAMAALAL